MLTQAKADLLALLIIAGASSAGQTGLLQQLLLVHCKYQHEGPQQHSTRPEM
jgi:hypothetical protein